MCHDDTFKDEQCMKKETLGTNDFIWLRKCKGAKVCVELPYYGEIIGACSIKVRSHYDGEVCANGNKCTSGICGGTKCKGLNPGIKCERGLGQCQKGYLCRRDVDSNGDAIGATTCQRPLDNGAKCRGFTDDSFDPSRNVCKLGYICSRKDNADPTCIEIGSQGAGTIVSNPMACDSGVYERQKDSNGYNLNTYECISTNSRTSVNGFYDTTTSRGGTFTNFANMTKMFKDWLKEAKDNNLKDEDANYEAYRYTRNKKKINKLFFQYRYAPWVEDADECAFDYKWKQNSSNSLKFSLMILVLALLF
jgi:hypothetical protein